MKYPISQKQVNAIASFIEAAQELEIEPFFSKDDKLLVQGVNSNKHIFTLGDRFHFRSALISFRRIWMPSESSHWKKVLTILGNSGLPEDLAALRDLHCIDEVLTSKAPFGIINTPPSQIIDLWLNTVFAHDGLEGRTKRADFEAVVTKIGHAHFEYNFRLLTKQLGQQFIQLAKMIAVPALEFYAETYKLKPTFKIGAAFGKKRRERTPEGHIIIRQGSTEFFSEETLEARLFRLLDRHENNQLGSILKAMEATKSEILRAILGAVSFRDFLTILDGKLITEELNNGKLRMPTGPKMLTHITDRLSYPVNIGDDNLVITTIEGEATLDKKLKQMQFLVLKGH